MIPDVPEPSWLARYRKFVVALGGAVLEAGALWQDAHPAAVGTIAFVVAALVAAIKNEPEPA
jgi:hypothetical protein